MAPAYLQLTHFFTYFNHEPKKNELPSPNFFLNLLVVFFSSIVSADEPLRPVDLRCEYLVNPVGVDVLEPRLSWKNESDQRGQK